MSVRWIRLAVDTYRGFGDLACFRVLCFALLFGEKVIVYGENLRLVRAFRL